MRIMAALLLSVMSSVVFSANLTTKSVEQWITSSADIHAWLEQNDDKLSELGAMETYDPEEVKKRTVLQLKEAKLYDSLAQQVRKAGYKNVEEWLDITQSISSAYLAIMLESQPDMRKQITEQLKMIQGMQMPAEQKAMMESMLSSSLSMLDAVEKVPSANLAAVRPNMPALMALFESSETVETIEVFPN